jgi:hypothetical protein
MGNLHLNYAFSVRGISSSRKFILVALADYADDNGVCWPCMRSLRTKTNLDRKVVLASVKELIARNLVKDTGKRKGRTTQVRVLQVVHNPKYGMVPDVAPVPDVDRVVVPDMAPVKDAINGTRNHQDQSPLEPFYKDQEQWFEKTVVSLRGVAIAQSYAPGWDMRELERKFIAFVKRRTKPRNPDAAFIAWVKKFTKGRPPS